GAPNAKKLGIKDFQQKVQPKLALPSPSRSSPWALQALCGRDAYVIDPFFGINDGAYAPTMRCMRGSVCALWP
ncbi:MAG TPA: hypothetical protein VGY66_22625, partial [Gemmataceae bacterium]|nr:hypothetical protein [Gemmataceae bacterium]